MLAQAIAAAQDQSYPFAERWRSYNSWCGGAAGTTAERILEDGRLGAPDGVRRAGYRLGGSHCAGVRIYAMGRRQRGDHLACHRARDVDRLPLGAARASQAPTQAVVDAADAHPRLRPPRVVGRLGRLISGVIPEHWRSRVICHVLESHSLTRFQGCARWITDA